jgi:hypothetical protein
MMAEASLPVPGAPCPVVIAPITGRALRSPPTVNVSVRQGNFLCVNEAVRCAAILQSLPARALLLMLLFLKHHHIHRCCTDQHLSIYLQICLLDSFNMVHMAGIVNVLTWLAQAPA